MHNHTFMKNIFFAGLAILLICAYGCTSDSSSSATTGDATTDITPVPAPSVQGVAGELTNWTCVPKKQVGAITANFTEADLIKTFGDKQVQRYEAGEGESDETYAATIVNPGTKNQLLVRWTKDQPYKKIESIRIEKDSTDWRTAEGITVGSTMADLVRINGKDFAFNGFYEAGEAGMTTNWQGGAVNPDLVLYLQPNNPEAIYEGAGLSKEATYSSSNALAKKADIRVSGLIIKF